MPKPNTLNTKGNMPSEVITHLNLFFGPITSTAH